MIYFLVFIIALNFFYAFGAFVLNVFFHNYLKDEENQWIKTFINLFAGIFASVFIYSVIMTKGITVNILTIIPLCFILYRYPPSLNFKGLRGRSFFNYRINLIAIPVFLIQLVFVLEGFRSLRLDFYPDIDYYAGVSYFINMGFENTYKALNTVCFDGLTIRTPYHYQELWISALLAKTFHLSSHSYLLVLVVSPLLFVLTNTGIIAIWGHYNNNKAGFIIMLLSFMMMFVGPMNEFFNGFILKHMGLYFDDTVVVFENSTHLNHFLLLKYLPFYALSCLFVITMLKKNFELALVIMSYALIINVGLIPGVYAGVFIYCFFLVCFKKYPLKKLLLPLLVYLLSAVSFIAFYHYFGAENQGVSFFREVDEYTYKFFNGLSLKAEFLRFVFRSFFAMIWVMVLYTVYIIFFLFTKNKIKRSLNKEEKGIILFVAAIVGVGFLIRPFMQGMDSLQFLSCLLPLLNVLLIVFLIKCFYHYKKAVVFLLFFSLIFNFSEFSVYTKTIRLFNKCQDYSEEYIHSVKSELGGKFDTKIGWLAEDDFVKNTPHNIWFFSVPAKFLKTIGYHNFYNINNPYIEFPDHILTPQGSILNKLFDHPEKIKHEELLMYFIDTYGIRYVVAHHGVVLPDVLQSRVARCIVDSISKEQFFVLKNTGVVEHHNSHDLKSKDTLNVNRFRRLHTFFSEKFPDKKSGQREPNKHPLSRMMHRGGAGESGNKIICAKINTTFL